MPPLGPASGLPFAIATLGAYFAITSSYVYNDCCDVDVDAVGMPGRPLPSSQVTRSAALAYSALLFGIAAAVAFYLNPESLVALIAATLVMVLYSKAAKRTTPSPGRSSASPSGSSPWGSGSPWPRLGSSRMAQASTPGPSSWGR